MRERQELDLNELMTAEGSAKLQLLTKDYYMNAKMLFHSSFCSYYYITRMLLSYYYYTPTIYISIYCGYHSLLLYVYTAEALFVHNSQFFHLQIMS